jgi:hypothetical protein
MQAKAKIKAMKWVIIFQKIFTFMPWNWRHTRRGAS